MEIKINIKKDTLKWCFIISMFNIALFSALETLIKDSTILNILGIIYIIMSNIIIYKVFKDN